MGLELVGGFLASGNGTLGGQETEGSMGVLVVKTLAFAQCFSLAKRCEQLVPYTNLVILK